MELRCKDLLGIADLSPEEIQLSDALKNKIKVYEEDRLFSEHPQFIKCENHLHETTWMTALENAEQHEFFLIEESWWDRFKSRLLKTKLKIKKIIDKFKKKH